MLNLILETEQQGRVKSYELHMSCDKSIYEAARDSGFRLPVSCLNGVCHVCRATLVEGRVRSGSACELVEHHSDDGLGKQIMLCQAWPESDCRIKLNHILGPGELPVKKVKCQLISVERLKGHVFEVVLQLPAGRLPEFFPGQYLALDVPGKSDPSYFSIASRPGLRELTLHIQADPHLNSAVEVISYLQKSAENRTTISLSLPFGEACLTGNPDQALILMAAGTGFAQMKSIIEHLISSGFKKPISLYWGVRKKEDMYLQELAEQWAEQFENFSFTPLFADVEHLAATEHHDQLSDAVLADQHDLANAKVFVSGSPKLVFSAMDALTEAGLPESQFFSDVLAYATRD